jgi:hypothetical protein
LYGSILLAAVGFCGCRSNSAALPAQQKAVQPVAQQPVQARAETDAEKSCREFVQGFYGWYFDRLDNDEKRHRSESAETDVIRMQPTRLTSPLRRMLQEDAAAQARERDYIVGLDFDPFINAQDWNGRYSVRRVSLKDGICSASVWGLDGDAEKEIVKPELRLQGTDWTFDNFYYPGNASSPESNLIEVLTRLRDARKHPAK